MFFQLNVLKHKASSLSKYLNVVSGCKDIGDMLHIP